MIGIVNKSEDFLNVICSNLGETLKASGLCYHATKYAELLKHPKETKFTLIISQKENYYNLIMESLTQTDRDTIEWIGTDWFDKEEPIPIIEKA